MNGTKVSPLNPNFLNNLSNKNVTLDIYSVVSNIDMQRNNIINCGTKPKTAPTPAIIPSTTKLVDHADAPKFVKPSLTISPKVSANHEIQSTVKLPTTPTDK